MGSPSASKNITLIGMAGAGKSSVGKRLAEKLGYRLLEIDAKLEKTHRMKLQQILDDFGETAFVEFEEREILALGDIEKCLISPGGSAIYSSRAMNFLKSISTVIFLDVPYSVIQKRLRNPGSRGIIGLRDSDLKSLFDQRMLMYRSWADLEIPVADTASIEEVVKKILQNIHPIA